MMSDGDVSLGSVREGQSEYLSCQRYRQEYPVFLAKFRDDERLPIVGPANSQFVRFKLVFELGGLRRGDRS